MPDNKRIYTIFDHGSDLLMYSELKKQSTINGLSCNFIMVDYCNGMPNNNFEHKIIASLKSSSVILVLVDENSKYLGGYYDFEIEQALKLNKPIIVSNKNNMRSIDFGNCPIRLRDKFVLHISSELKIILLALQVWPIYFEKNITKGYHSVYFDDSVYEKYIK